MTDEADRQNTCAVLLLYTSSVCVERMKETRRKEKVISVNSVIHEYPDQGEWLCSEKWNFSFNRTRGYAPSP